MLYTLNHEDKIEQGDICYNLPKFLPSDLIPEEPSTSVWDNYLESLRENKTPKLKYSLFPSPTWGVVLSQTCDIENAKDDFSILFAELNEIKDYKNIDDLPSIKKKRSHIQNIIDTIRNEPATHYLPQLYIDNYRILGPWKLNFKKIFFVRLELLKNNKDLFWKARLKSPGLEVLKDKISRFFTRLAFEECLYFSHNENEFYIDDRRKGKREEIMKTRRECGYND